MKRVFAAFVLSVLGAFVPAYAIVPLSAVGATDRDEGMAAAASGQARPMTSAPPVTIQPPSTIRRAPVPAQQPPVTIMPGANRGPVKILPPPLPPALLVNVGATLTVCIVEEPGCSGEAGVYKREAASIPVDAKTKVRRLYWSTNSPAVTGGLLQVSAHPFNGAWPAPPGAFSRSVEKQSFLVDFDDAFGNDRIEKLTAPGMVNADYSMQATRNTAPLNRSAVRPPLRRNRVSQEAVFAVIAPKLSLNTAGFAYQPVWYVRVVPLAGDKIAGQPTNEVVVKVVPPQKRDAFEFYVPAKMYEVRIKSFEPARAPDKGVCPNAMILDTDYTVGIGSMKKTMKAGERLCPTPYKGMGEQAWYEQLWDALKSGLNWVSKAYNALKSMVVSAVGGLVCAGDATCQAVLSAGLDIGLAAMGLPPSIPNFDQLVDGGFDYLAGELAAQAGCPDSVCKSAIKSGLKTALEQAKNTNPGCLGAEEAHSMGMEPLCLPPGVTAHRDPAGTYRAAQVVLEVKRTSVDGNSTVPFYVYWSNYALNAGPVGGLISNIEPYGKTLQITAPLEGPLFGSKSIRIPPLDKGQTIEIPINLAAADYWVPGHKELMEGWSTVTFKDGWPQYQYNDWWLLYYGASLTMSASIDGCPGMHNYTPACIVSSDTKNVTLPMSLNSGY